MENRCNYNSCCGCTACKEICKFGAISIFRDDYGFNAAKIDEDKCTHCGLCGLICPTKEKAYSEEKLLPFALYTKDINESMKSTSGGAFFHIAREFIKLGYIAYGALNVGPTEVNIVECNNLDELEHLRGVKYIQPNIDSSIYPIIKKRLSSGGKVLYSGLACHIQALINYLSSSKE